MIALKRRHLAWLLLFTLALGAATCSSTVSLPTSPARLRGADLLSDKLQALENCRREAVPVVLAETVVAGVNEGQLGELVDFALRNSDIVCGLFLQPAFQSGRFTVPTQRHLSTGDMANLVAEQTCGRIAARDFWPLGCCHPRCSCATYLVGDADSYVPFTRTIDRETYRAYFSQTSPQGAIFTDILAQMASSTARKSPATRAGPGACTPTPRCASIR